MPIRAAKREDVSTRNCPKEAAKILAAFDGGEYVIQHGRLYAAKHPQRVTRAPVGDLWPLGPANWTKGAFRVRILGKEYPAGRIAWLVEYREWPPGNVRHLNGDNSDTRIENLSVGPKPREHRNSKYVGVRGRDGKFYARAGNVSLGTYETEGEAARARDAWVIKHRKRDGELNFCAVYHDEGGSSRQRAGASPEIARELREAAKSTKRNKTSARGAGAAGGRSFRQRRKPSQARPAATKGE